MARMKFVPTHLPHIQNQCMFELVSSNYRIQHTRDSTDVKERDYRLNSTDVKDRDYRLNSTDVKERDYRLNSTDKNYKTQELYWKENDEGFISPDINIPELLCMLESTDQMESWLQPISELTYSTSSDNGIPSHIRHPSFEELIQDAIAHGDSHPTTTSIGS